MKVLESFLRNALLSAENSSVGRVQTVVLKWIADQTLRHEASKTLFFTFELFGRKWNVEAIDEVKASTLKGFQVPLKVKVRVTPLGIEEKRPPPPFTTDSALQEISRVLGWSVSAVSKALQSLYERGYISYPRTDSPFISPLSFGIIKNVARLYNIDEDKLKARFLQRGGETHEAIVVKAPTLASNIFEDFLKKPFAIVVARSIASQMNESAFLKKVKVTFEVYKGDELVGVGKQELYSGIKRKGWLEAYEVVFKDAQINKSVIPNLIRDVKEGTYKVVGNVVSGSKEPFLKAYEVIRIMKERGVGRPSTYATVLETLEKRGYVINRNNLLIATKRGFTLLNFLHYLASFTRAHVSPFGGELESMTSHLKESMDIIERSDVEVAPVLLFKELKKDLNKLEDLFERYKKLLVLWRW